MSSVRSPWFQLSGIGDELALLTLSKVMSFSSMTTLLVVSPVSRHLTIKLPSASNMTESMRKGDGAGKEGGQNLASRLYKFLFFAMFQLLSIQYSISVSLFSRDKREFPRYRSRLSHGLFWSSPEAALVSSAPGSFGRAGEQWIGPRPPGSSPAPYACCFAS